MMQRGPVFLVFCLLALTGYHRRAVLSTPFLPILRLCDFGRIRANRLPTLCLVSIKTIPRLEGATPSTAGRPPGARGLGSAPGLRPVRGPGPRVPGGLAWFCPTATARSPPRSNKTAVLFKTSIEQNRCCCSVAAGLGGAVSPCAGAGLPRRPGPRRRRPFVRAPCLASGWSRVRLLPGTPRQAVAAFRRSRSARGSPASLLPFGPPCGNAPCGGCR